MKILLIGYGRMGKMIESITLNTDDEVIGRVTKTEDIKNYAGHADVAIEFTQPDAAVENILECFKAEIPIVCGTTGWYHQLDRVKREAEKHRGTLLYSSNFSIGVQLFFQICKHASALISKYKDYKPSIREVHHTRKLDAPSGTAITLAEYVLQHYPSLQKYSSNNTDDETLIIQSVREGDVPGIHQLYFTSQIDEIHISHQAFSREGFARGALAAAAWIRNRTGVFTMEEFLDLTK